MITASADQARVYAQENRRGYWSRALPVVLEKHGLLDVEVHAHDAVAAADLAGAGVVLAGHAAGSPWTAELVAWALSGQGELIAEGPLPPPLEERLGVRSRPAPRAGSLLVTDGALRSSSLRYGDAVGGHVNLGEWDRSEREPAMDWAALRVPIGLERAAAWHGPGWDALRWTRPDGEGAATLVDWIDAGDAGDAWPAVVARDGLVGCCFGLFGFLGQSHTSPPADGPLARKWPRSAGTEALLLALIDRAFERRGRVRARAMPWPAGHSWALTVRHDVDRPMSATQAGAIVRRHRAAGTAATWYWRALRAQDDGGAEAARIVAASAGHEVAHHTERLWAGDEEERRALERAARAPMRGSCAHGDRTCFRWQGAPNVLRAAAFGYRYTELLSHAHLLPHRFATFGEDGVVAPLDVVCLPHHESFDRGMKPGQTYADEFDVPLERARRASGCLQVLNHPDLHREEFFAFLESVPADGRLDMTAAALADWWHASHVLGELRVRCADDGTVAIDARTPLRGLVVERRWPDGRIDYLAADVDGHAEISGPGAPSPLDLVPASSPAASPAAATGGWERDVAPRFARLLMPEGAPAGDGRRITAEINSTLVPARAGELLRLRRALTGDDGLAGLDVLDAGSGVGALTLYLALACGARSVLGVDTREAFVRQAAEIAAQSGVANVRYDVGDITSLAALDDASVDVVIANNVLSYLDGPEQVEAALAAFARVARAGATLIAHQTLRAGGDGRIRRLAPAALRERAAAAGFADVRIAGLRGGRLLRGPAASLAGSFAVAGRRR